MADTFNSILTTSLYAAVVGLFIILLKGVLKNRLNAKWHYLIWIVLILKLLIPFGPESAISIFNAVPQIPQAGMSEFTYQIPEQDAEFSITEDSRLDKEPGQYQVGSKQWLALAGKLLPYVWITGVAVMLLWLGFTYYLLYRRLRKRSFATDERTANIFTACKSKMQINNNLGIVVQDAIAVPSLFGILQPKILLSPAASKLSDKDLQYVLLHEMAHYKRKDVLANYLLIVLQSIHWFNPVIWYCFKHIRQDMELAADELVLARLQNAEHRDYGRALLNVLEGFSTSNLAPRLLGMVDDKKNIERRLQMIKMTDFFQSRRKLIPLLGILCLLVLGGVLLTSGINKPDTVSGSNSTYDANTLIKYKSDYVGDNSKVVNLVSRLPLSNFRKEASLQTGNPPYGIIVNYDFRNAAINQAELKMTLRDNAAVIFALIKNADIITYNAIMPGSSEQSIYQCSRMEIQRDFPKDLRDYAQNTDVFEPFLGNITFKVFASPKQYTAAMSSTPGIRLSARYEGAASKVCYSAKNGVLLTMHEPAGKISKGVHSIEISYGNPVYWSPVEENGKKISSDAKISVAILDEKGRKLDEKQVMIIYDDSFYIVSRSSSIIFGSETSSGHQPTDLNEAVSQAIKARESAYLEGEATTEGHIILESEEQNGTVKVYTMASVGAFGFENGIFTKISGSGAIPTVMTFSKNQKGEYALLEYKEPDDGAGYPSSIKKMFPSRLQDRVLSNHGDYAELIKQEEKQAGEYLKSIGRSARIMAHVDKKSLDIGAEASNKLFVEYSQNDAFLNACPHWIGSREVIENGERVIYKTSQSKSSDGYDLITFKKTKENGSVIKVQQYKIIGTVVRRRLP